MRQEFRNRALCSCEIDGSEILRWLQSLQIYFLSIAIVPS